MPFMQNPIINPTILVSPVEDGYVAYDPVSDRLHQLNPIAAILAELCDGIRSVDDIRNLVAPILPDGKASEIDRWIDDGLKVGLIKWKGSETASYRELTAAELFDLAKRLRMKGAMQTAYLCGKRAADLEPTDTDMSYVLGDLALSVGRRGEARAAYQKYFDLSPDDAEIGHLLIALKDEAPPPRASNRTIQQIYKGFSSSYETRMVDDLRYQGPEHLRTAIKSVFQDEPRNLNILDLGCGTGLAGVFLKRWSSCLTGIDLSPEMIELAHARGIYDRFEVAEITTWLERTSECFDLIVSLDCLIYFGDLERIVAAVAKRLNSGGVFAFSMERGPVNPFRLTDTGRYEHHPDHVRDVAARAGLAVGRLNEAFLRMEYFVEVMGLYAVLKKLES
jgi:predicted TPR repeat methyltransferase